MKKNIIKFNLVDEIEYANSPKPSKNYILKVCCHERNNKQN